MAEKTKERKGKTELDRDFLIGLYERMLLIRRFEEKAAQMYGLRKIGGFLHLYIGQEAVAVGSIAALDLAQRLRAHRLPGPRARHRLRLRPEGPDGRAVRQGHRDLEGQGRVDAPLRRPPPLPGRQRHRRRPHPGRHGGGAEGALPPGEGGGALLLRRRGDPPGLLPREPEHGQDLEAAHPLHLREQPLRHGHRLPPGLLGHRLLGDGRLLRHPGRAGGRHGRAGSLPPDAGHDRAGARGERAGLHRDEDLPLPGALDERPGQVPHQGRAGEATAGRTRC